MHEKTVLITGGSSGIGEAAAREFARRGARVILTGRHQERGEAVARSLDGARFIAADLGIPADIEQLFAQAGPVDYAVNNAASGDISPVRTADLSEEEFDRTMSVNVKGLWLCMKYELKGMLAKGGGAIVNISSVNGLSGTPYAAAYCASKHAVLGLTKTAALEYATDGIRVNAICPGAFHTPMLHGVMDRLGEREAMVEAYSARIPMRRIGDPAEVARAIAWLCSDEASYVTGHVMTVDGGIAAGLA